MEGILVSIFYGIQVDFGWILESMLDVFLGLDRSENEVQHSLDIRGVKKTNYGFAWRNAQAQGGLWGGDKTAGILDFRPIESEALDCIDPGKALCWPSDTPKAPT